MKYIYSLVILTLILFIGISFFYLNTSSKRSSENSQDEFARGSIDSQKKIRIRSRERSLFEEDSKFLEFKNMGIEEIDSGELTPIERERRKKLIIEKSKKLAEKFPHNSIIPRDRSPEEEKKITEANQRMAMIQNNFLQNEKVSKEDKLFYYQERLKISKDRLEIFRYAFGLQNGGVFDESKLDDVTKERYSDFLENEKAYANEISKVEKE